jgi:hypothetical protein
MIPVPLSTNAALSQNITSSAYFAVKPGSENEKTPLPELPREALDHNDIGIRLHCN